MRAQLAEIGKGREGNAPSRGIPKSSPGVDPDQLGQLQAHYPLATEGREFPAPGGLEPDPGAGILPQRPPEVTDGGGPLARGDPAARQLFQDLPSWRKKNDAAGVALQFSKNGAQIRERVPIPIRQSDAEGAPAELRQIEFPFAERSASIRHPPSLTHLGIRARKRRAIRPGWDGRACPDPPRPGIVRPEWTGRSASLWPWY